MSRAAFLAQVQISMKIWKIYSFCYVKCCY
uniref:Uncharacterized protein n=1 Tax=Anguilla anguilla TaxID=7936 RepID=A0A0E9QNL6_ANGAN